MHFKPSNPNRAITGKVTASDKTPKDQLRIQALKVFKSDMGICAIEVQQTDGQKYKAGNYEGNLEYKVTDNLLGIEIVFNADGDNYLQAINFYHRDGTEPVRFGPKDRFPGRSVRLDLRPNERFAYAEFDNSDVVMGVKWFTYLN